MVQTIKLELDSHEKFNRSSSVNNLLGGCAEQGTVPKANAGQTLSQTYLPFREMVEMIFNSLRVTCFLVSIGWLYQRGHE